jgi:hypothetical protein
MRRALKAKNWSREIEQQQERHGENRQGEVSVKQLKGLFYDPKRKPASIGEMHEAMMRAVAKANIPARTKTTKQ